MPPSPRVLPALGIAATIALWIQGAFANIREAQTPRLTTNTRIKSGGGTTTTGKSSKDAPSPPSAQCAGREEWRSPCRLWSGEAHHRYFLLNEMKPREGIGGQLMRVCWALNRAVEFDLEPVFLGPFIAGHGVGDFAKWIGLTHNPMIQIEDPSGFQEASRVKIPLPFADGEEELAWFRSQRNRTSVVYVPDFMEVYFPTKIMPGVPVFPPPTDKRLCPSVRHFLRAAFWSVPEKRTHCMSMLPRNGDPGLRGTGVGGDGTLVGGVPVYSSAADGVESPRHRPWVVGVHVRRGDMVHHLDGIYNIPHVYYVATVRSVLRSISVVDPNTTVSVLVFSEGGGQEDKNQVPDERNRPVGWDIERESCRELGIRCTQVSGLRGSRSCRNLPHQVTSE